MRKNHLTNRLVVTISLLALLANNPFVGLSASKPIRVLAELNVGETKEVKLSNGQLVKLKLIKADEIRDEIYAENSYHSTYEPMRCIRAKRFKLIRRFAEHSRVMPVNMDDGISKQFILENGYLETGTQENLLFDLYFDPCERMNLVKDSKYAEIYKELSERLEKWMKDTEDPLLDHPRIPLNEGGWTNPDVKIHTNEYTKNIHDRDWNYYTADKKIRL
jgi:hypothetical protein